MSKGLRGIDPEDRFRNSTLDLNLFTTKTTGLLAS